MVSAQQKQRRQKGRKRGSQQSKDKAWASTGPICSLPAPTNRIYRFERWISPAVLTPPAADKGYVFSYTLGNFSGATEFTALFDLYRMTSIEVTFSLTYYVATSPVLNFLADYDTFTVPATIDTVMQRPHKRVVLTPTHPTYTYKLRPRVLGVVQTSSGTSSASLVPAAQWMDCNDSTVTYGGLLGWIENFNTTTGTTIQVTVRGLFDFAMVR
jgi:hypothetical protein